MTEDNNTWAYSQSSNDPYEKMKADKDRIMNRALKRSMQRSQAIKSVMTGGNHLADYLIRHVGPDFIRIVDYDQALHTYGIDIANVFYAWKQIMNLRDDLDIENDEAAYGDTELEKRAKRAQAAINQDVAGAK